MAQFNQVLGQTEKTTLEEVSHYYPTLTDSSAVRYIVNSIGPEDQHLQGQQILVATDQLMLIENQGQVILDPSQVSYQPTSQYIVHDATATIIDNRAPQQVYFMKDEISSTDTIQLPQSNPPVVLNHLQPAQLKAQLANTITHKATILQAQMSPSPTRQIQNNQPRISLQTRQLPQLNNLNLQQRIGIQSQIHKQVMNSHPQKTVSPNVSIQDDADDNCVENITLSNGDVVSVPEYKKKLIDEKKKELKETSESTILAPAKKRNNKNSTGRGKKNTLPTVPRITGRSPINKTINTNIQTDNKRQNNIHGNDSSPRLLQTSETNQFPNQNQSIRNASNLLQQQQFIKNLQTSPNVQHQQLQKTLNNLKHQHQNIQGQQPVKNVENIQPQNQNTKNIRQPVQLCNKIEQHPHLQQMPQQSRQSHPQQHPQVEEQSNYIQPQYIIHPPSHLKERKVNPLPSYVPSTQIQKIIESTPVSEEYNDSIRMLVLLENGEQRLITFTLPKEVCTIQEILEQVGVPFQKHTRIELIETNSNGIDYFVTVGNFPKLQEQLNQQLPKTEETSVEEVSSTTSSQSKQEPNLDPPRQVTPEPVKEVPKFVAGKCAVCEHCGYLSETFHRCLRCNRKLPEDVKSMPLADRNSILQQNQHSSSKNDIDQLHTTISGGITLNTKNPLGKKKPKLKTVEQEPVILTLSSDDDEDSNFTNKSPVTDHLFKRHSESALSLSTIKKEPSLSDIEKNSQGQIGISMTGLPEICVEISCRNMRIGSYKFSPVDNKLLVKTSGISFDVPSPKNHAEIKTITIEKEGLVKVLASFQKLMPVLFYYCSPAVAGTIRDELDMTKDGEYYFDPLSEEEAFKRITVLINTMSEEARNLLRKIYSLPINIMDELTSAEANELLCKTCPKEISNVISSVGYVEIKQLLIYPQGKGGLSINTEDYMCLAQDQFLNDVIIDFYLKYLILNLPPEVQEKVYVFSTFFYKRLTTKPIKATRKSHPNEHDPNLTPAQKRHARVEKWTKSVNLFEKDFIIVPINENCHWFLAIICFPSLSGCFTFDGKSVKLQSKQKKIKVRKEEKPISCEELEASDKDEAEGDESELESEEEGDSEKIVSEKDVGQPIKQPCILIFDSLAGTGRSRVVATLRDYLTCEYKAKLGNERIFTKDVVKGACPKVPQQTNFTDCGLYLLQYVEQFFLNPIKDYRMPIKQLKNWFDEISVTKKREDIANLIKELMMKYNKDPSILPDITLPTRNGKLLSPNHFMDECEDEEFEEEEEEDEDEDEEEVDELDLERYRREFVSKFSNESINQNEDDIQEKENITKSKKSGVVFSDEESCNYTSTENFQPQDDFVQEQVTQKPDLSEIAPKVTSRDTLSYLKAKRINRHKNVDHSDAKKFKTSE